MRMENNIDTEKPIKKELLDEQLKDYQKPKDILEKREY
jgi:hypothetical protein